MLIDILNKINSINENMFAGFDSFVEHFGMPDWLCDAIIDSFHVLPLLFIVFIAIEFIEYFYAEKINNFMKNTEKASPIIGSLAAIIPQCGFSVIASTLYVRRFITRGTLLAIYLATSDEAIPVLLSNPESYHYVIPVIAVKLLVAIPAGYLVDFLFKQQEQEPLQHDEYGDEHIEEGCCHHEIMKGRRRDLVIHPVKHTLHTFAFILVITLILNYFISVDVISSFYSSDITAFKIFQPFVTAIVGLLPNCAVSIAITLMLIKGTISFGAAMAGLMSNAGLGLLVLIRMNNIKDTLKNILILLVISTVCGIVLQFLF